MEINVIACINKKFAIGKDGGLMFHIGNDLKNFKRMTLNNVVIMGRKTFESLPNSSPLKERINIIITRDENFSVDSAFENVYIVHSPSEAIELSECLFDDKKIFVIGGESIYKWFLDNDLVSKMYITEVNNDDDGDSYFPNVFDKFYLFYQSYTQRQRTDETTYKFSIYEKI